ncbi:MAG: hypothetical protein IJ189_01935 [Clostridia bacterium]|nr:hypothetical protein [Clostridia bacterium]
MKSILYDLRCAIAGRWFLAALIATTAALYLSVGQATYGLIGYLESYELFEDHSFWYAMSDLLALGMKGDFGLLTLPALSALPFAAQALHEIKSGAIRPAVFRAGRKNWIIGKVAGCAISGMLLQGAAVGLLFLILNGLMYGIAGQWFPWGEGGDFWLLLFNRMLCGGIWAGVGCVIALATETASAAYLAPLCLCYALMMIGTRFFPDMAMLNPMQWVNGAAWLLVILLIITIALQILFLKRGVQKYA